MKASFVSFLNKKYPSLTTSILETLISDELISPFQVKLSENQIGIIKSEIQSYWKLRQWGTENLQQQAENLNLTKPNNYAVCMSYDFHINPEGLPELIEINTNASFLALGLELYSFFNLKNAVSDFSEQQLMQMFKDEIKLLNKTENSVAIVDETPSEQRLYLEFLIYKLIFQKNNIKSEIFNISEIEEFKKYSLIYNRYTDFYLSEEKSIKIKNEFEQNQLSLSPNPTEYFLLADKQRLLDWNNQTDVALPTSLLKTYDLGLADKDFIWSIRKNLFIKPKNSYGGKQAYKAASISRKLFDGIFNNNFIAQQLSVPATINVDYNNENIDFKYDLRCFVYKNELQLIIARLYQGQTTNLKTQGGGFACVVVS